MKKFLLLIGSLLWAVTLFAQPTPVAGVKRLVAGTNITLSPTNGTGTVTVNSSGGGGGTPGGSSGDIQYNNAGAFGGITPGTGVVTALGVNVGSAGAPVLNGGVLGTPSSGTVTNLTGTASININGTVGATTPSTVAGTTGVFGSTTSLLLGTAGSAVGNIGFRNATSGTATLAPPTGALGTYSVTLPNAASTLPIFGQQITFAGPTAARTVTLLDLAYTTARQDAAQTFTGVQSFTSPDFTTSVTTPSASFTAWAGATTLLTFGGTGASASTFFPSTLDTSSSITGAIRTSGGISAAKALNIGTTITGGGALSIGTTNAATVGTIELGAASDTTIARVGAGQISVEGVNVVTTSSTDTLTNKTLTSPVINGATSSGSTAINLGGNSGAFTTPSGANLLSGPTTITPTARSSGAASYFTLTTPADTNQTLSTESIGFSKTAATRQWATGALTTQREVVLAAPTYGFVGASTLTTAINLDIADPIQGTNATLTNIYGLRVNNQQVTGTLTANTGTNKIGPLVDSVDGTTPLNNISQTIAAGTAYTLTATSAAVAFGTTSPIITFSNAGTYWVSCDIQYSYVGSTFAANRQFDAKLRRTNNTPADVSGSTFSEFVPVMTTITNAGPHTHIGPVLYSTAGTTDTIQVFADISTLPSAGTVTVSACTITAMRAF